MYFTATNPATGEQLRSFPMLTGDELSVRLDRAQAVFPTWRSVGIRDRVRPLLEAARILREDADELAHVMAKEMGKPLAEGRSEVEKCAWGCEFYANEGPGFLEDRTVDAGGARTLVSYRPLGAVFGIMPWNFPLWQVFRFAAPTLAAGNVVLVKHAPTVPECALAIERIFDRAGLPDGAFQNLFIDHDQARSVIEHDAVRAVTLTGSTRAGKAVAALAASVVKKSVLELGGSDPFVVLEDADVGSAAAAAVRSRLINAGQSCIAAKRLIVVEAALEEFQDHVVRLMSEARTGDPTDPATTVGPLARSDLRDSLARQVEVSVAMGARCLLGGSIPPGPGAFYPPTVITDVAPGMPAYEEELFGPVAAILPVRDEQEALRVANDTELRSGSHRIHSRREAGRTDREGRAGCRKLLRERLRQVRPQGAVRGHQTERLRPRARPGRDP